MSRFLDAARLLPVDATPVWFMRQAGRSLPEYRRIRERWSLFDIVDNAELCAEVTLQPVRRLGVDAAVMFSDIVLPLRALGLHFRLVDGVGPMLDDPVRSAARVQRLPRRPVEEAVPQMMAAVAATVKVSPVPVIAFAGAPFTLASYIVEGGPSRDHLQVKRFMWSEPEAFQGLMAMIAAVTLDYLSAQVGAGAQAVQLFDSWVGALSRDDYVRWVLPHSRTILEGLEPLGVPRIHFGTGTSALLEDMAGAGGDVVGLDWRIPLDRAWERIGHRRAVQGNLDPALMLAPREYALGRVDEILRQAGSRPGHIFNLGHGVLPETPVAMLQAVVEKVHAGVSD